MFVNAQVSYSYQVLPGVDVVIRVAICDEPGLTKLNVPLVKNGATLPLQHAEAFEVSRVARAARSCEDVTFTQQRIVWLVFSTTSHQCLTTNK